MESRQKALRHHNRLMETVARLCNTAPARQGEGDTFMRQHVSVSPLHGSFAPGYEPGPSDLENLASGRETELPDLVYQAKLQRFLSGHVDVLRQPLGQEVLGDTCPLAQNSVGSLLFMQGRL